MRLLDLFCGAGGAAMGYFRAGFTEIVGIDIKPQPRYPFAFIQADALTMPVDISCFDAIHASPPCHEYSTGTRHRKNAGIVYPNLLPATQELLRGLGVPFVIENVSGAARLMATPLMLCGGMFGLGVRRHRFFETNQRLPLLIHKCNRLEIDADEVSVTRHGPPARWYRKNPDREFSIKRWHDAMGIGWMVRSELTQAIPPAYTEWLGRRLIEAIAEKGTD